MGGFDDNKPAMAMFGLQLIYAGVTLSARAALSQGMNPRVFVFYRQAIATLVMVPIAYFTRRNTGSCHLGLKSFFLIFLASLIGVTVNQIIYFEGIYLASSSVGSALFNLVPVITFVIATAFGLEKVNIRSLRGIAKIIGTAICVSGALGMAFLRGPKLLHTQIFLPTQSVFGPSRENWLVGCLLCFGSSCCWSIWLILQVPVSKTYPDHLSLSAWMCFMSTLQSATITLFLEHNLNALKLHSLLELTCCFYSGILGSGFCFVVQAWCISRRGPLFSALFNPLCAVIVTIFASIFLHEEIYIGRLAGGICVITGIYVVLWGKAKDIEEFSQESDPMLQHNQTNNVHDMIDESKQKTSCTTDLEESLLPKKFYTS